MHGFSSADLLKFLGWCVVVMAVALGLVGGTGGWLFGFGFLSGAWVGAVVGVVLVLAVVALWWFGVPL